VKIQNEVHQKHCLGSDDMNSQKEYNDVLKLTILILFAT